MGGKSESKKPSCILLQHKSPYPRVYPSRQSPQSSQAISFTAQPGPSCMMMLWSKPCCQHALASTAWVHKWAQVSGTPVPIPLNYRRSSLRRYPWGSPRILMPSCALCCLTWPSAPTAALLSTHPLPVLPQPLPSLSSCLALAGQLPSGAQLGLGHHSNSFLSLLINLQPLEPSFCSKNVAGSLLLQDFCSSWDT